MMITIFNRRELIITMSMKTQADIRNILAANNIDYTIKTRNLQASPWYANSRLRTGSFGVNTDYIYEYKIYVHKNDYDWALYLIK